MSMAQRSDAVHVRAELARMFEPLRMRNAAACYHPVHFPGPDFLFKAKTVTMRDRAIIEIGDS